MTRTMTQEQAQEWLAALGNDARRQLQDTVDRAVRFARRSSYCSQFNAVMQAVLPAFVINERVYDSDGVACDTSKLGPGSFGPDGYDENGYDADGWNRRGVNRQGYTSDGFTESRDADGFNRDGWGREEYRYFGEAPEDSGDDEYYTPIEWASEEQRNQYQGSGRYVYLNRDGDYRRGRVPDTSTPPFNPTTWQPAMADAVTA